MSRRRERCARPWTAIRQCAGLSTVVSRQAGDAGRAQRKPRLLLRFEGAFLLRFDDRRFAAPSLFQLPPRLTRAACPGRSSVMRNTGEIKPPAAVIEDAYQAWLWTDARVAVFPVLARRQLGHRLLDAILDALAATTEAAYLPRGRRVERLREASRSLTLAPRGLVAFARADAPSAGPRRRGRQRSS